MTLAASRSRIMRMIANRLKAGFVAPNTSQLNAPAGTGAAALVFPQVAGPGIIPFRGRVQRVRADLYGLGLDRALIDCLSDEPGWLRLTSFDMAGCDFSVNLLACRTKSIREASKS